MVNNSAAAFAAGVPDSGSVQEVIFWQGRTIEMMYAIIGKAMEQSEHKVQGWHPRDYLAFYCLGEPHCDTICCSHLQAAGSNSVSRYSRWCLCVLKWR